MDSATWNHFLEVLQPWAEREIQPYTQRVIQAGANRSIPPTPNHEGVVTEVADTPSCHQSEPVMATKTLIFYRLDENDKRSMRANDFEGDYILLVGNHEEGELAVWSRPADNDQHGQGKGRALYRKGHEWIFRNNKHDDKRYLGLDFWKGLTLYGGIQDLFEHPYNNKKEYTNSPDSEARKMVSGYDALEAISKLPNASDAKAAFRGSMYRVLEYALDHPDEFQFQVVEGHGASRRVISQNDRTIIGKIDPVVRRFFAQETHRRDEERARSRRKRRILKAYTTIPLTKDDDGSEDSGVRDAGTQTPGGHGDPQKEDIEIPDTPTPKKDDAQHMYNSIDDIPDTLYGVPLANAVLRWAYRADIKLYEKILPKYWPIAMNKKKDVRTYVLAMADELKSA